MTFAPSDELLSALTDSCEIGMIQLGADCRVKLWNAWIAKAANIPRRDALGRPLTELFPELDGSRIATSVEQALTTGVTAFLSSSLNKRLFPLQHEGRLAERPEPMQQIVVIKPVTAESGNSCLIQVFDVTNMAHREALLRQQARTMEALAENYRMSEMHNRAIVNDTADAIITFGDQGAISTYNRAAEHIFGYHFDDIIHQKISVLIPDLDVTDGIITPSSFASGRREVISIRKGGVPFQLELSLSAMDLGGQKLFVAVGHDITERKLAEEEVRRQKEWLSTLINAMPDLVCFKDGMGRWLVANQYYLDISGLTGIDYQGRTSVQLAQMSNGRTEYLQNTVEADERAWRKGKPVADERILPSPDGDTKIFDVVKIPLFNPDGSRRGLVVVGRDITERKQAAARIHHIAHHDPLTGLPNRILFQERLRHALAQGKRSGQSTALMFLDLDKFKDINDTLGHHVGDLLLKAVAKRLLYCVRETDTVARLGGDEFAVVLTNIEDPKGASNVAEAIIQAIAKPFEMEEHEVRTSTSIGITIAPDDSDDAELLLKNADLAMFRSKAEGRNTYHYYVAEMDSEVQARKAIERDLRLALGTDQLMMHYQPLIDAKTREIHGCEALLRWHHPTRGWMSPAKFIPIAERTDLIVPLSRWILRQACEQGQLWTKEGLPPLQIAVNLSPAQFKHHQGLVDMVSEILEETGFPPQRLQLEITEGIAMQNIDVTVEVLRTLRNMGALISIDDFGTGYSSLNYLKRFPVDKLKIDRSFVVDIGRHPDNAAVVEAIVNLGHSLGTRVNVEGVETREQLDFLLAHDVDEAQGFFFSPALPPKDFAQLVREKSPWPLD